MNELRSNTDGLLFWGVPVVVFIGVAAVISAYELNIPLFLWIQGAAGSAYGSVWQSVTLFGDGLVAIVLCAVWLRSRPEAVWAALLGAIPAALIVRVFKMTTDVPRPLAVLLDRVHVLGPAFRHASFPSGHAITAFLIAGIACSVYRSASARFLIMACASLVALSRIVVGLHWPIDVLGGAAAGWVCAHAGLVGARRWPVARWKLASVALLAIVLAASITLFYARLDLPLAHAVRYTLAVAGCILCVIALFDLLKGSRFSADLGPWIAAGGLSIRIRFP